MLLSVFKVVGRPEALSKFPQALLLYFNKSTNLNRTATDEEAKVDKIDLIP
jgi:hypothetical protein